MEQEEKLRFEADVTDLHQNLTSLSDDAFLKQLLLKIHQPGFTTPAEYFLMQQLIDVMQQKAGQLLQLKDALLHASNLVVDKQNAATYNACGSAQAAYQRNCNIINNIDSQPDWEKDPLLVKQMKAATNANQLIVRANPRCNFPPCLM